MARRTPGQLRLLRDALLRIELLRLPDYRNSYIALWEERTKASVPRFPDAQHDLSSLLRTAEQVHGGMAAWVSILLDGPGATIPVEDFRALLAAEDAADAETVRPVPASATPAPARVFVSYSHDDDTITYGRISALVADLDAAYRNASGEHTGIFKDDVSIRVGDQWRAAIEHAGRTATILLAFLSPAYLRSEWCRREAGDFLDRADSPVLLPLVFFDRATLKRQFAEDPLWQRLDRLQMLPVEALRSADPGSREWLTTRDRIARRITEVLAG